MSSSSNIHRQFPMERVLHNLHHKCCSFALQYTSHRSRRLAEHCILIFAVCCFGALLLAHLTFVQRGTTTTRSSSISTICLNSIPGFDRGTAVTHLMLIEDGISSVVSSNKTRRKDDDDELDDEFCAQKDASVDAEQILFSYSRERGYLLLSPEALHRHSVDIQYIKISKTDAKCFGEPFLQTLIGLAGPDTVMINWLLGVYETGFIYNPRTNTMFDLSIKSKSSASYFSENNIIQQRAVFLRKLQPLLSKGAVVVKTSFLFFITTTLVSFTLRETQGRMLDFTHHLQQHVRANQPVVNLVTTHVVENLVFVPIMVGMIFFLIEFYRGDKFLAFMVLSLVWVCESFSVLSLRTKPAIHFFPRIFFLLFALFHFYNFSFPFGFSYTALATSMCFMMHSMLFFWHRYELPAVALGRLTPEHPRQGISSSTSSTPSVQSDSGRNTPEVAVPLRGGNLGRAHSFNTIASDRISRQSSSTAMFQGGDDGDESYMYYLGGEVVMHRGGRRTPSPFTPITDQAMTPQDPTAAATVTEPRRNRSGRIVANQHFVNELGPLVSTSGVSSQEDARISPQLMIETQDNEDNLLIEDDSETSALQVILSATEGSPSEWNADRNSVSSCTNDPNTSLTVPGLRSTE